MKAYKILNSCCLILILFINSCQKDNVLSEFDVYVNRFIEEAKKRGVRININTPKLIMKFGNVSQCKHLQDRKEILINADNWQRFDELEREFLIFHELGHCYLSLDHNNCVLPDGTSESMMAGYQGKCSEIDYIFTVYGGMRRKYYIDQLFNEKVSLPEWAKIDEFADKYISYKKNGIFYKEFDDTSNVAFLGKFETTINSGKIDVKGDANIQFNDFKVNDINQNNVEIETSFKFLDNVNDNISFNFVPLFQKDVYDSFGFSIEKSKADFILRINVNYLIGLRKNINKYLNDNAYNTIKFQRVNNTLYIYLNNKAIFIQDVIGASKPTFYLFNQPIVGKFFIETHGKCSFDYVRVNKIVL